MTERTRDRFLVVSLRNTPLSRVILWIAKRLGAETHGALPGARALQDGVDIDLTGIPDLDTLGQARYALLKSARGAYLDCVDRSAFQRLGSRVLGSEDAGDALYAVLSAQVAARAARLAPTLAYAKFLRMKTIVLSDSQWDRRCLSTMPDVKVFPILSRTIRVSSRRRSPSHDEARRVVPVMEEGLRSTHQAKAVFVTQNGLSYAGLYKLEQWLSGDPKSSLHEANLAFLTYGDSTAPGPSQHFLPVPWSFAARHMPRVLWNVFIELRAGAPGLHWRAAKLLVGAARTRIQLQHAFPSARLLILAYESLTPPQILIAGRASKATLVATHDRPNTAWQDQYPKIADVLVVANEEVERELRNSPSCSVGSIKVAGLWKTDLLVSEPHPAQSTRESAKPLIVVLPYHVAEPPRANLAALALSPEALEHFLRFVADLAGRFHNANFVIRSKSASWLEDPNCERSRAILASHTNIVVDTDYEDNARSYKLCREARVVIAKYTSLVDECLATGIPVLVHDSGPTWRDATESALPYLPKAMWIRGLDHASDTIKEALESNSSGRRPLAVPRSPLADGRVRSRVQLLAARLLDEDGLPNLE